MLEVLHGEFSRQFEDLKAVETEMLTISFSPTCQVDNVASVAQLELIDLQPDALLAERFKSVSLLTFDSSLKDENFPHMRSVAQMTLGLFGSAYTCKQTFSVMKFSKSRCKSCISDEHLLCSSHLHMANSRITPNFNAQVHAQHILDSSCHNVQCTKLR